MTKDRFINNNIMMIFMVIILFIIKSGETGESVERLTVDNEKKERQRLQ